MSRGPENNFISSVHKYLPAGLYRMKNHNEFNAGIADCWYSGTRADLWVEYKFIVVPVRGDTVIDLTSGKNPSISFLQQDWLESRSAEGRNVGVVVGSKDGGVWFPGTSWGRPILAKHFRSMLGSRADLAALITSAVQ
jgi:hypothetical protein